MKSEMILVPIIWLESLLKIAEELEQENKDWDYGIDQRNSKIHFKMMALLGYSKSASTILKYNERIDK